MIKFSRIWSAKMFFGYFCEKYLYSFDLQFGTFCYLCKGNPFLIRKRMCFYNKRPFYKSLIINSFTRSIVDASIEARYICVVAMES